MSRMRIEKLGEKGLNQDIQPYLLPPNTFTRMDNCATRDGELVSVRGETLLFYIPIKPLYHTSFITTGGLQLLIISNGYQILTYDMEGTPSDITPSTGLTGGAITFTSLNGILVVNSRSDGAFYYNSTTLLPLPGWDVAWRCFQIVAYKYYLVALGMQELNQDFPQKVRWSNSAQEGAIPTEWIATTSNDAGDDLIGETAGFITGGCLVRESLFIVKEDSVYSMNYVGGRFVMQLSRLSGSAVGTKVIRGFAEVKGGLVLFTSNDLLFFDGNKSVSLVDQRIRTSIVTSGSTEQWLLSQLYVHTPTSTVFLSFVPAGYDQLRIAYIYDWEENTWGSRVLNYSYGFDSAYISISEKIPPWDQLTFEDWDAQNYFIWNRGVYQPSTQATIIYESNDTDTIWWISAIDLSSTSYDNTPKTCLAERISIPIEGADGLAMVTEVWPEVRGTAESIDLYIGGQDKANGDVRWDGPHAVVPGQTVSITPRITGRFIALRVESATTGHWGLSSLTLNWNRAGER